MMYGIQLYIYFQPADCPKDMLLHDGDCVMCPDFSGRELNSLPDVCVCGTNAATPVNGATSTSDPDRGCTGQYAYTRVYVCAFCELMRAMIHDATLLREMCNFKGNILLLPAKCYKQTEGNCILSLCPYCNLALIY